MTLSRNGIAAAAAVLLAAGNWGAVLHAQERLRVVTIATPLEHPWAAAFLEGGRFLVTERPGRMRVVAPDGALGPPLKGVPAVVASGQGGLLDVVTDVDYARNRRIYFCYAEPAVQGNGSSTALASATLVAQENRLEDLRVLFRQQPKVASALHFGCRIAQVPAGPLFLTLGERYQRMQDAQTLANHHGKVIRIGRDGGVPGDNPFVKRAGALPEIWSYGHRNPQGATIAPDGRLWIHEHGPQGGDEINLPQAGRNYGWPVVTFGENYGGGAIGEGHSKPGMELPLHQWTPSIAPSGMAFLTSDRYGPAWKGNLFVGSLKFGTLHRLEIVGDKVMAEERLLQELGERIRDVRQGPDGALYLLTDSPTGRLLRLDAAVAHRTGGE